MTVLKPVIISRSTALALMVLVLLVGAGLRFGSLSTYPPGVSNDESLDVLDAFHIARSGIYPFYEDLGRPEPLYPLTLAAATALIGPGVWTARLATAFVGIVTLAALYWCATECFHDLQPTARRLAALLAVIVLATAIGHLTLSRALYRGIWQPLGMLLCIGWCLRALRTSSYRAAILSGAFLALTLYSYTAAYIFPVVFVGLGVWTLIFRRRAWRQWLPILLIIAGISAILMLPVGLRFLQSRQAVVGRASAVSGGWGLETMLGLIPTLFFANGDQNPQYNAARAPLIAPVLQPLFVLGLLVLIARIKRPSTPLILGALAVGTLPVLLSQEVPHGLRIAGEYAVFPLVIGAAGAGIAWVMKRAWHAMPLRMAKEKRAQYAVPLQMMTLGSVGLLAILLIWQARESWAAYRGYWENADQYRLWEIYDERLDHNEWFFRTDRRRFADWLLTQEEPILLPFEEMQELVTRTYLLRHYDQFATADASIVLPENTRLVVPWALETHDIRRETQRYVLLNEGTITFLPPLTDDSHEALLQEIDSAEEIYRVEGELGFGGYTRLIDDWQPTFATEHQFETPVVYGHDVQIVGWYGSTSLPIETPFTFDATLNMQSLRPNGHDYWFTVQLLDQDGTRIASNMDGPILRWLYPTTQWAAQNRVPVPVSFEVPALRPGAYQLVVGVYSQFGDLLEASIGPVAGHNLPPIAQLKVPQRTPVVVPDTAIQTETVFADTFALIGAETQATDDGQTQVNLYWRSLVDQPIYDATIFVHLLDESGEIMAQNDSRPWNGQYPTSIWGKDEIVMTTHLLNAAPDDIHLRIGMYTFPGPQNLLASNDETAVEIKE